MRIYFLRTVVLCLATFALRAEHAVMIDSGSTGSRVFIYQIVGNKITLVDKLKVEPGLSKFENKLGEVDAYLKPLIDFAKKTLGEGARFTETPIVLQATGGVRALSLKGQNDVIASAQQALNHSGFKAPKAEVIQGVQEGIYQWISINYLRGSLTDTTKPTAGLVEMGGASMQVTFLKQEPLLVSPIDPQLYSVSYDGFGETAAWNRLGSKACKKIPLSYAKCRNYLQKSLNEIRQPKLQGDFYLVDNFEQLASLLKLEKISSKILDQLGPATCRKTLRKLKSELRHESEYYLSKICFDTAYMSVVLEKIGFKRERELIAAKHIEDTALSWTLGTLYDQMSSSQKAPAVP